MCWRLEFPLGRLLMDTSCASETLPGFIFSSRLQVVRLHGGEGRGRRMIHPNALWAVVLIMSTAHYLLTDVCSVCLCELSQVCVCVPRWSVSCSGAWLGPRRWRRPCCSPRARTRTASLRCVSAGVFSGSPDGSRPWSSPRTVGGSREQHGSGPQAL